MLVNPENEAGTYEMQARGYYDLAVHFCKFIREEKLCGDTINELMILLMRLYTECLQLPSVELEDVGSHWCETDNLSMVYHFTDAAPTLYWQVFDPYVLEEPVGGDLNDDISDIMSDLFHGILEYEAGNLNNALFHWKWGIDSHWGSHVVNALRALHSLRVQ